MPKLPRGQKPRLSVHVKLPPDLVLALAQIEQETGETRTGIVERLLRTALNSEGKKILEKKEGTLGAP